MRNRDNARILAPTAVAGRLSRRSFLGGTAFAGLAGSGLLSACGGDDTSGSTTSATTDGKLGNELNMFSWGSYDDPRVLKNFTKEFGPKFTIDGYGSNEEMIAKLVAAEGTGGYDIVVPTGSFIPQMAENGLLMELDHSKLPNLSNVQAEFLGQDFDPENKWSVCKDWGSTGYVYDKTKITRELTSWADFLDAAQNEAAGQTSVLDDPIEVLMIAMFAEGIDINTTDPDELDVVERIMVEQLAPQVKVFDSYPGSGAMAQGTSMLLEAWNGEARQGILATEDDRWKWVLPSEGSSLWMDNWSIPVGAKHVDEAYAFINYVLEPEVSLQELAYIGYHTGVEGIQEAAEAEGIEMLDLIFFTEEELGRLVNHELNEAQQRIVDIFGAMKAKAGS